MANEKMTKREVLNLILGIVNGTENITPNEDAITAYCENEIAILDRKSEKAKTVQSKTQKENEGVKGIIYKALCDNDKPVTVTELIKTVPELADKSNQKISALLRQLILENKVTKTIEGKTSKFSVVADTTA